MLSGETLASSKHDGRPMPQRYGHEGADSGATVPGTAPQSTEERFRVGLARAFAGAIIFALPLLMTMEMWWLGFYMVRLRLTLLLVLLLPLLVGLAYHAGFEESFTWRHAMVSAAVAYAVGFSAAVAVLAMLAVIGRGMSADEILGKILLQSVPGSFGALLARSLLGEHKAEERERGRSERYAGEIFLMAVGALFLAFNVAPTEEIVLIAYQMTHWHALILIGVSLVMMHAFVYALGFRGQSSIPSGTPAWSMFLRFTVVGYAVVLLISVYVLWTFGRADGMAVDKIVMMTVVLGFPAALGAAAARLLI
jgi:putative integral membrane protein (TIGR02587 family)